MPCPSGDDEHWRQAWEVYDPMDMLVADDAVTEAIEMARRLIREGEGLRYRNRPII